MRIIKLDGYNATVDDGKKLELGTFDSYGEEQLQIVKAQNWENLSVIATFNPPNKKPVQVVVDSVTGVIKVPKEATANLYGVGTIVFVGLADGVQRISTDVQYIVKKHSNANGTEPPQPTPPTVNSFSPCPLPTACPASLSRLVATIRMKMGSNGFATRWTWREG